MYNWIWSWLFGLIKIELSLDMLQKGLLIAPPKIIKFDIQRRCFIVVAWHKLHTQVVRLISTLLLIFRVDTRYQFGNLLLKTEVVH